MFRSPYTKFYITSLSVTQIALTNKSSLREEVSLPSPAVTPRFYPTNLESRPLLQALPVCRAGSRSTSRFVVLPSRFAVLPSFYVTLRRFTVTLRRSTVLLRRLTSRLAESRHASLYRFLIGASSIYRVGYRSRKSSVVLVLFWSSFWRAYELRVGITSLHRFVL